MELHVYHKRDGILILLVWQYVRNKLFYGRSKRKQSLGYQLLPWLFGILYERERCLVRLMDWLDVIFIKDQLKSRDVC